MDDEPESPATLYEVIPYVIDLKGKKDMRLVDGPSDKVVLSDVKLWKSKKPRFEDVMEPPVNDVSEGESSRTPSVQPLRGDGGKDTLLGMKGERQSEKELKKPAGDKKKARTLMKQEMKRERRARAKAKKKEKAAAKTREDAEAIAKRLAEEKLAARNLRKKNKTRPKKLARGKAGS